MVTWDAAMTSYFFGDYHPMNPCRLDATARLAQDLGLFELGHVRVEKPHVADDAALRTAHSREYIDSVKAVSADPSLKIPGSGLDGEDTPGVAGLHEAAARLAGGSELAAESMVDGSTVRAVNFGGGMHHAHRDYASGFCVYNDCAVAIQRLLDRGVQRVLYIDIDAHHGDGTQSIFWDEPRVLTISLHETGMSLFPGTGFSNEMGADGDALGSVVNVALPTTVSDGAWLRAFHAIVPQLARAFDPEVIVSQHGCDSHYKDDMTHMRLSVDAQREATMTIADLADELTEDRWLALGGGGYNCLDAVPRSWAHLVGIVAGRPVEPTLPTPESWRTYIADKYGTRAPRLMGDEADVWWRSWEIGFDPSDALDRTVMATRKAVFPLWGLDPWFD
ncbi:acetoin utilization protein AcuC [Kocuria massiliensis]|uniref:acetoin utilization protein AcuC n=1 Tax=Kocuria massiliensis TaxID=1926282 RepID=UPI003B3BCD87